MSRPRLIPCIILKHGLIVRSQTFSVHQVLGNPISTISRLSNWNVDELVLLDISSGEFHDIRRDDHHVRYNDSSTLGVLKQIADACFMPLTFGGRIRTLEDMRQRLAAGADKCAINTQAKQTPKFITEAAKTFGSQCVVVSIDAKRHGDSRLEVFTHGGKEPAAMTPVEWARQAEDLGAGEIFLNSIDRDGTAKGYDIDLISSVTEAVDIPVIACGGVGGYGDFPKSITEGGASAAAAANIFHFHELSYPLAKRACLDAGVPMRAIGLNSRWFQREPVYDKEAEDRRLEERLHRAHANAAPSVKEDKPRPRVKWCNKCLYPSLSATPMEFDDDGVCMGCRMSEAVHDTPPKEWARRKELLADILERNRCCDGSRHDCVIAVSGGKDSYYQTHFIKNELGLNPLLVTYYGNNFLEVGERNLLRMKEVFDLDHIIYQPGVDLLKKLNRLGFTVMGDMNWHNHVGIATVPIRIAAQHKIPIVIWGEHGYSDICGQYSTNDYMEWTYRLRLEHLGRNYEWNYFVGREGITAQDMSCYQYPSDQEIFDLNLRGIFLGNYVPWNANEHIKLVQEKYGFEVSSEPFDRTYRMMSNLDDMHENGVHDYLKFIKFGYGRCTDHTSKDIRSGAMGRGQGIDLVRKYDHVKPGDLQRWLEYVGMGEEEFDAIADTFRDPRVWRRENGEWVKDNVWDAVDG